MAKLKIAFHMVKGKAVYNASARRGYKTYSGNYQIQKKHYGRGAGKKWKTPEGTKSHSGRAKNIIWGSTLSLGASTFGMVNWREAHGVGTGLRMKIQKLMPAVHQEVMKKLRIAQKQVIEIAQSAAGWADLTGNAYDSLAVGIYTTRKQTIDDTQFVSSKSIATRGKISKGVFRTQKEKKQKVHIVKVPFTKEFRFIPDDSPWITDTTGGFARRETAQMMKLYKAEYVQDKRPDEWDAYEFAIKSGVEYAEMLKTVDGRYYMRLLRKEARKVIEKQLSRIRIIHADGINVPLNKAGFKYV